MSYIPPEYPIVQWEIFTSSYVRFPYEGDINRYIPAYIILDDLCILLSNSRLYQVQHRRRGARSRDTRSRWLLGVWRLQQLPQH